MQVSQDFIEAVKKSLSQNSVEVVQGLLKDSDELGRTRETLSGVRNENAEYKKMYSELQDRNKILEEKNKNLEKHAREVNETAKNQDIFKANLERDAEKSKSDMLFKLIDKLFSNRIVNETLNESIANIENSEYDNQGNCHTSRYPVGKTIRRTQEIQ